MISPEWREEMQKNFKVRRKIERDWTKPESVSIKALKKEINEKLNKKKF